MVYCFAHETVSARLQLLICIVASSFWASLLTGLKDLSAGLRLNEFRQLSSQLWLLSSANPESLRLRQAFLIILNSSTLDCADSLSSIRICCLFVTCGWWQNLNRGHFALLSLFWL